ncbi:MAG: DUF3800 domain-containing protein [Thaumarchaeota archaeon]|nr:DUF3800 domain-containing protein [Nitrososphaerota archaeon]
MKGVETMLMFGDSSGNPSLTGGGLAGSPHYIVGTITMNAPTARRIDSLVLDLKRRHLGADPMKAELHGSALKKALFRRTRDRDAAEREFGAMVNGVIRIANTNDFFINMVITDKGRPNEKAGYKKVIRASWSHAADKFCQNLLRVTHETVGITILDRYDDATNRVVGRAVSQSMSQLGLVRHARSAAIPHPMFVDSRSSNLVQLVDMITYVVARHESNPSDEAFSRWYRRLLPRIGSIVSISVD